jgi:hypothetical protein
LLVCNRWANYALRLKGAIQRDTDIRVGAIEKVDSCNAAQGGTPIPNANQSLGGL